MVRDDVAATRCRTMPAWTGRRPLTPILAAGRRLGARGLISAGEGNLSVRLDAERLLISPPGDARTS